MAATRLHRTVLEVERKFSRLLVYPLSVNGGIPAFRELAYLGARTFRDTYFDRQNLLADRGTWVRQRDGRWESKVWQAGDYNNSQFQEICGLDEIGRQVQSITNTSLPSSQAFGLSMVADITTYRETWKADNRFTIILDRTDFGHMVGEVELEASVTVQTEKEAKKHCSLMDAEVASFMQRYHWAFDTSAAVGKLTAYFAQGNS